MKLLYSGAQRNFSSVFSAGSYRVDADGNVECENSAALLKLFPTLFREVKEAPAPKPVQEAKPEVKKAPVALKAALKAKKKKE